jgi:hypothetical protein
MINSTEAKTYATKEIFATYKKVIKDLVEKLGKGKITSEIFFTAQEEATRLFSFGFGGISTYRDANYQKAKETAREEMEKTFGRVEDVLAKKYGYGESRGERHDVVDVVIDGIFEARKRVCAPAPQP